MENKDDLNQKAHILEIKIQESLIRSNDKELLALYEELLKIYTKLGYKFQVSKIKYEVEKYRKKISARKTQNTASESSHNVPNVAIPTFSTIQSNPSYQRDLPKSFAETQFDEKNISLSHKVEQARKARMEVFEAKKEGSSLTSYQNTMQERRQKILEAREKKKKEDECLEKANNLLDQAKKLLDKKNFDEAAELYRKAGDKFKEIGWTQQSNIIYDEIKNCQTMKEAYLFKMKSQEEHRIKEKEAFETRAANIIAEKQRLTKLKEDRERDLSPAMKEKAKMADMINEKAKKLIEKGKIDKVIPRLEYLITLYEEIGFKDKVVEIKKKINSLK